MENNQEQIKIFIAYSREDISYLQKLRKYLSVLKRGNSVKIWYDGEIKPGTRWNNEIKTHLELSLIHI